MYVPQEAFGSSGTPALVNEQTMTGTWAYLSGVSGTVVVPAGRRVIGIAAHATSTGSVTINGGDSIPVPANVGMEMAPKGNLTAPTIVVPFT